ncbi:hypothetical protein L218DRAFT_799911, partial [Marasmius fiardii PR-910]
YVVPIHLADSWVVYSEEKGVVVFNPEGGSRLVHFSDVLHVPDLHNNLLSPFHLTC